MSRERRALVVLGMHRSGTSALAGLLGDLGCSLPADLMEPAPMNAKGFVESNQLTTLDDELLAAFGSRWFDWRPLQVNPASPEAQDFAERALKTLDQVFGDANLFVLKDPRVCRLAPFWMDVLGRATCTPAFVCMYRDPREVAASLDTWAGYDQTYGELLWLRYALDAEADTRGHPRVHTSYERLLADSSDVAGTIADGLSLEWPRSPADVRRDPDAFVDRGLRRSRADESGGTALSPWTEQVYAVLRRWVEEGEDPADHNLLDRVRHDLDHVSPAFANLIDSGRRADVTARRLRDSTTELTREREALMTEQAAARSKLERLGQDHTALLARVDELEAALLARADELEAALARTDELETALARVEELETALAVAEDQRDRLRRRASVDLRASIEGSLSSLATARNQLARSEASMAALTRKQRRLRARIVELESSHDALLASRSWRVTGPLRAVSGLFRRSDSDEPGTS